MKKIEAALTKQMPVILAPLTLESIWLYHALAAEGFHVTAFRDRSDRVQGKDYCGVPIRKAPPFQIVRSCVMETSWGYSLGMKLTA